MNKYTRAAGVMITTGALAAGGYGVVGMASAAVASTAHTIRFVSHPIRDVHLGNTDVQTSRETHAGKTVGYDISDCVFDFSVGRAACHVAVGRRGGLLYGAFHFNANANNGPLHGKITGGTGVYRGATGTFVGTQRSGSTKIVVTYSN
jgi:hypothetical protein